MRFLLDLPGRFFEIVGKIAVVVLPILLVWTLYGIATEHCISFRRGQSCMNDEPISFWFFTGLISISLMVYVIAAIFLLLNVRKALRARRNLRVQQAGKRR
ncbi:hypothetical protein ACI3KW_10145 [Devosia sp. ZW T5_3]|uniref:hypothetical protein n=1 Tax=Devosia sp. ZW T5_3 TaxID=3378085 RepID=UPI003851C225